MGKTKKCLTGAKVIRRALYNTGADGCVTASVDRVDFKRPGCLGDLVTMTAEIKTIGRSSFQVRITVVRESTDGLREDICAANFTFVALKEKKPFHHGLNFEKLEN